MLKKIKNKTKNFFKSVVLPDNSNLTAISERILIQNGKLLSHNLNRAEVKTLNDAEFKVFSQWGDDGIIQYLVSNIDIKNKFFIEFGVENYLESNTRFLMINNNWSGLIMDGSANHVHTIKNSDYYWKYDLIAKQAFVTAENINNLINDEHIPRDIGLLHIDIDGNDYWIWKALEVVNPIIVIVEYNSVFGCEKFITIPYRADFDRTKAHHSNLFAGASLPALYKLANEKGYDFIGCNSAGNNAYFVRKDSMGSLKALTIEQGYILSKFRESRNDTGLLDYLSGVERLKILKGLEVYNTETNQIEKL